MCLIGCKNESSTVEETTYPQGFEIFDNGNICFIKYRNKINGYDVKIAVSPFDYFEDGLRGCAEIAFMRGDTCFMRFRNDYFRIDSLGVKQIENGDIIELDYKYPLLDKTKPIELGLFKSLPFFFLDANFDGKDELFITYSGAGQRTINAYAVYGLLHSLGHTYYDYLYDSVRDSEPFSNLDDMSEVDYKNKEISTFVYGGYSDSEKRIYKMKDDKPYLHCIEDYDSLGWLLARRQILKVDTITTYHNGREYLYKK